MSGLRIMKCGNPNFEEISKKMFEDPSTVSPCCHNYVEEVLDKMWEEFSPLIENSKNFTEKTKKEISHEASIACMKQAMSHSEIQIALASKISELT